LKSLTTAVSLVVLEILIYEFHFVMLSAACGSEMRWDFRTGDDELFPAFLRVLSLELCRCIMFSF